MFRLAALLLAIVLAFASAPAQDARPSASSDSTNKSRVGAPQIPSHQPGASPASRNGLPSTADPDSPATTQGLGAANSQAVVPRLIKFSGTLRDLSGKPITGTTDLTFALYKDEEGGTPLWLETQTIQADGLGHYTALLGAMTPSGVPVELFSSGEAHWLGVQAGNLPEQPRVLLVSVPYALKAGDAETLGGKPASAYILASQSAAQEQGLAAAATASAFSSSVEPANAAPTRPGKPINRSISQNHSANYIAGFKDDSGTLGNSVIYQTSTDDIGIGTTSPISPLQVGDAGGWPSGWEYPGEMMSYLHNPASSSVGAVMGMVRTDASGAGDWNAGVYGEASSDSNSSLSFQGMAGGVFETFALGNTSFSDNQDGVQTYSERDGTGTTPNMSGVHVWTNGKNGGTVTNNYGVMIDDQSGVGNNNWSLYAGGASPSFFGGSVGIGTPAPSANLEVNGTAKFDGTVTFASGQTFTGNGSGLTTLNAGNLVTGTIPSGVLSGTYGIGITGNAATATLATNASLLNGVATYARLDTANTFNGDQSISGNQNLTGNLFVGNGTPMGIPLEVKAAGNDALTVDSSGTVSVGAAIAPAHVTTGSANSDFAGQISLAGASFGSYTFQTAFSTNPPVCVVTPSSNLGSVTWYVNVTKTQLWVYLSSGTATVTFNYVCVGNPN